MRTEPASNRYLRHVQQLRGLHTDRAVSDRAQLIAGSVLVCLGVSLVLLGWDGASGTPLVFEQIPYMISGGLLGLGLIVLGGLVYFAYWLSLLVRDNRQERRQLIALLSSIDARLAERALPAEPLAVANGAGSNPVSGKAATPRPRTKGESSR